MFDPIDDNTHYVWNTFYFNREDSRVLVPKRMRQSGFTFNFAHPVSYFIVACILVCCFLLAYYLS